MKPVLLVATMTMIAAPLLSSCGGTISDAYVIKDEPGHVKATTGGNLVTVTDPATRRLGIETTQVTTSGQGLVVPATAVFVDSTGAWWVYKANGPNEFMREEVDIERIEGGQAVLRSGPPPGTAVVVVGVAELYGIEEEVGH